MHLSKHQIWRDKSQVVVGAYIIQSWQIVCNPISISQQVNVMLTKHPFRPLFNNVSN